MNAHPSFVYSALIANACHQAVLVALVPVLQHLFDVELSLVGLLVGAGLALSAIAVPIWGCRIPVLGITRALNFILFSTILSVIILGTSLWMVAEAVLWPLHGFILFAGARILYCLNAPAVLPLSQALWAEQEQKPNHLLGMVGHLNSLNGVGRIVGNLSVTPLLASGFGPALVLLLPLPLYLFSWVKLLFTPKLKRESQTPDKSKTSIPRALLPRFILACTIQLSIGIAYILIGPIIQQAQGSDAETSAALAGVCLAVSIASGLLANLTLKTLFGKRQSFGQFLAALAGTAALFWLGIAPDFYQIVIAAALLSGSVATLLSLNTTQALLDPTPSHSAKTSTILSSAQFVGLSTGTILGGALGQTSIFMACNIAASCVLLSGLYAAFLSFKRQ